MFIFIIILELYIYDVVRVVKSITYRYLLYVYISAAVINMIV